MNNSDPTRFCELKHKSLQNIIEEKFITIAEKIEKILVEIKEIKKDDGYNATPLQYTLWDSIKYNGTLYRNICPAKYQETNMGDDIEGPDNTDVVRDLRGCEIVVEDQWVPHQPTDGDVDQRFR